MKGNLYGSIQFLNWRFDEITIALQHLQDLGLLTGEFTEARKAGIEEIRSRTNHALAQALEKREAQDWGKFEELRIQAVNRETETAKAQQKSG